VKLLGRGDKRSAREGGWGRKRIRKELPSGEQRGNHGTTLRDKKGVSLGGLDQGGSERGENGRGGKLTKNRYEPEASGVNLSCGGDRGTKKRDRKQSGKVTELREFSLKKISAVNGGNGMKWGTG